MSQAGQQLTKAVYEDPELVEGFIQKNAVTPKAIALIDQFSQTVEPRGKILDLGCGPGHESYIFAEKGFSVTGLDYSHEMIRRARELKQSDTSPVFMVGDMRLLTQYFQPNSFDAIWASASLLHLEADEVPNVLEQMTSIVRVGAPIYVGLKGGTGTHLITQSKYGKPADREFTLWTKDSFLAQTARLNWELTNFMTYEGSLMNGKPTEWLRFFFKVKKY